MRDEPAVDIRPPSKFPERGRRVVLYLIDDARGQVGDFALTALGALRPWADRLVAIVSSGTEEADRARLAACVDQVFLTDGSTSDSTAYAVALRALRSHIVTADEIVFTGNSWYGPVRSLDPIFAMMDTRELHAWQMTGNVDGPPESFPEEGFPSRGLVWQWLAVRKEVLFSSEWSRLWAGPARPEQDFATALADSGFTTGFAFPPTDYPRGDPALFAPDLLIADGYPFLNRAIFAQYPPFLDRHAVFGRELLGVVAEQGFPLDEVWRDLARTVPPKALNSIAGMLEVLPESRTAYDEERPFRIAVVAFVPDVAFVDELLLRLSNLPPGFDLVVTTGDGGRARAIETRVAQHPDPPFEHFETRVSWTRRGVDKAALLIACRDIILGDDYDLLLAVHGRVSLRKTDNMRDYSRRYQLDNLLSSTGYVENVLGLFQREPGLGLVFPPMIHIGNAIMGRGWGPYRDVALGLCERLGVRVPLDRVTPLAPFGGMWFGRPAALRPLARERWSDNDYGKAGGRRYVELGRVQERLIPLVAGELGYHCRTILNGEHASISHTSLEYKADQMFSTTRGYPVEQIRFMHTLGFTGHGGVVALTRMYLRLNHPAISSAMQPLYRAFYRAYTIAQRVRRGMRRAIRGDEGPDL
jgi:rhamnosyltransferase